MKPKLLLGLALVLSGVLFGCSTSNRLPAESRDHQHESGSNGLGGRVSALATNTGVRVVSTVATNQVGAIVTTETFTRGGQANQWNVQVTRLIIAWPTTIAKTNLEGGAVSENAGSYPKHNNRSSGVIVNLRVTAPKGQVVDDYFSDATITSFMDDKGKNLLTDDRDEKLLHSAEGITQTGYSKGSSFMWMEVKSSELPSKGATELKLVGKVVVKTASQSKEFTVRNVKLDKGTKFDLGDLQVAVSDVRMKDDKFLVTLDADQDLTAIASLEVFDEQGKLVDASMSDSADVRDTKKHVVEFSERMLTFDKHLDNVTIKATCWTDLKTTEVPINVKIGLGL